MAAGGGVIVSGLMSDNDGLDHVTWHSSWQKINTALGGGTPVRRRRTWRGAGSTIKKKVGLVGLSCGDDELLVA